MGDGHHAAILGAARLERRVETGVLVLARPQGPGRKPSERGGEPDALLRPGDVALEPRGGAHLGDREPTRHGWMVPLFYVTLFLQLERTAVRCRLRGANLRLEGGRRRSFADLLGKLNQLPRDRCGRGAVRLRPRAGEAAGVGEDGARLPVAGRPDRAQPTARRSPGAGNRWAPASSAFAARIGRGAPASIAAATRSMAALNRLARPN